MMRTLHADPTLRALPGAYTRECFEPERCDPKTLDRLEDELYGLHCAIFDRVDRAAFRRYVLAPDGDANTVCVFRDPEGEAVGYASVFQVDAELAGRRVRILRGAVGFRPEARGRSLAASFFTPYILRAIAGAALRGRLCVIAAAPVSPAMYLSLTRAFAEVHPSVRGPDAEQAQRALDDLRGIFDLPRGSTPGSARIGWVSRLTPREWARIRTDPDPELAFYLERNPRFADGEGLLFYAPLHARNIVAGLRRVARTRRRRAA